MGRDAFPQCENDEESGFPNAAVGHYSTERNRLSIPKSLKRKEGGCHNRAAASFSYVHRRMAMAKVIEFHMPLKFQKKVK